MPNHRTPYTEKIAGRLTLEIDSAIRLHADLVERPMNTVMNEILAIGLDTVENHPKGLEGVNRLRELRAKRAQEKAEEVKKDVVPTGSDKPVHGGKRVARGSRAQEAPAAKSAPSSPRKTSLGRKK